jgi:Ser/Thr protein kinase RdoA (MazF antagonist)
MSRDTFDAVLAEVLSRFPAGRHGNPKPLGNHGGFSGARLWRVEGFCLRAWPPDDSFPARLDHIHQLMTQARDAGLTFVPRLERAADGSSCIEHGGRWWELVEWLPGRADYCDRPTTARLQAACCALARLHVMWGRGSVRTDVCPAVQRRFDSLRQWHELRTGGWDPLTVVTASDRLRSLTERAVAVLARRLASIQPWLTPWAEPRWPLQPCLCDVWHDHLLFEEDRLTGLIDYGSVKLDHVAADLARLLGSLVEDDDEGWHVGLTAYRSVRPLSAEEAELARTLDRTGTVLGVANWLRWLYAEHRAFENRDAVAQRLGTLVTRLEKWQR